MYATEPPLIGPDGEGALIETVGAVFTTSNVALGPAAGQEPPRLLAVPAAMPIPRLPSPLILDMVTVRVLPLPLTDDTVPVAVPVLFRVTLAEERLMVSSRPV